MRFDDLSSVEPWSGSAQLLPPGWHDVEIVAGEETTAKTGTPQWQLLMENEEGQITDWVAVTPRTLGRVRGVLECAGIEIPRGEFEFVPSGLVGRRVGVHVKEGTKPDGSRKVEVVAYRPPASQTPSVASSALPSSTADSDLPF